jgi:signal transduction histidine kinase
VSVALAEGFFSDNILWRQFSIILTITLTLTLPWRRTYPLLMVTIAFGAKAVLQTVALLYGIQWFGLASNFFVLILPYALLRWGSGREIILGTIVIAVSITISMIMEQRSWMEALGASLFLIVPATLGIFTRFQDSTNRRINQEARSQERERLARELHDTVAHHVSAIAVQAQAGQILAATRPEAPVEILGIIEEAASKTLKEMRNIVRALRDDTEVDRTPMAKLADIKGLAQDSACPLDVSVTLTGELDDLDTTLESTLYRLAQEAVTNSVRHARGAKSVSVHVIGETDQIRLRVSDDGDYIAQPPPSGLGLRGMAERVELLGGNLHAAPDRPRGWLVDAVLPNHRAK